MECFVGLHFGVCRFCRVGSFAVSVAASFFLFFWLVASVLFPCRTYVGLMLWPAVISFCPCRCCLLSGVPDFRRLIAFSFFKFFPKLGHESLKLLRSASEYSFFKVASTCIFVPHLACQVSAVLSQCSLCSATVSKHFLSLIL